MNLTLIAFAVVAGVLCFSLAQRDIPCCALSRLDHVVHCRARDNSSSAQRDIPRCALSRLDHVDCPYRTVHSRARDNEFTIHHTTLKVDKSGFVRCIVKKTNQKRLHITDLGTEEMRIIYSSGFTIGEYYDNQLLMEYKVACGENELAFFNVTDIDIESVDACNDRNGHPRCQDYILIDRGSFGTTEVCGNATLENEVGGLERGRFTVIFRSSELNRRPGFRMLVVCFKPEEKNMEDCVRADEFTSSVCPNDSGSGMPLDSMPGSGRDMRKRNVKDDEMTDVLDDYGFRMQRDLVEFNNKWRRRKEVDGTRFVERNVFHNETVKFRDRTLLVLDSDGVVVDDYTDVYVLQTFDAAGRVRVFVHRSGRISGPGPLRIVDRYANFQLFIIDPRGLIPDEEETMQLQAMTMELLNAVPAANDPNVTDPDQTIEDIHLPGINNTRRRKQVFEPFDNPRVMNGRQREQDNETAREVDESAVFAALRNREACNPVLRAQSRATLNYYRDLNESAVEALETFPLDCSMNFTLLICTSEVPTLPGRTNCQINNEEPFICEPFHESPPPTIDRLSELPSYNLTVTAISCNGQTGKVTIEV